ncbi:MAG TPA: hypothetical protein PK230_00125 [Chitinophagales bacterium]|nr:hypothetical protein [Chitinophagales bacterium]
MPKLLFGVLCKTTYFCIIKTNKQSNTTQTYKNIASCCAVFIQITQTIQTYSSPQTHYLPTQDHTSLHPNSFY